MSAGIQFAELLAYNEEENRRWKQFFSRHPQALDLPLDIAGDVGKLVLHIFAVELFFANAVSDGEKIDLDKLPSETLDEIFLIGERASGMYREFLAKAKPEDWVEAIGVGFGELRASRRKLVAQALTHSLRHWAQISTFLRQQGLKQEWNHDFLMSKAIE
ncbi:MAG: DinB family protein [Acidobacteriia bacterium]|nr:DinB family protein [Terriglobia bacterium]